MSEKNQEELRRLAARILRNQFFIMNALATMLDNSGGMATGFHSTNLKQRALDTDDFLKHL